MSEFLQILGPNGNMWLLSIVAIVTVTVQVVLLQASARKEFRHIRLVALQNCVCLIDIVFSQTAGTSVSEDNQKLWRSKLNEVATCGLFVPSDIEKDFQHFIRAALAADSPSGVLGACSTECLNWLRDRCCEQADLDYGSFWPAWIRKPLRAERMSRSSAVASRQ